MRSKRQASWLPAGGSGADGLSASLTAGRDEPGAKEPAREAGKYGRTRPGPFFISGYGTDED